MERKEIVSKAGAVRTAKKSRAAVRNQKLAAAARRRQGNPEVKRIMRQRGVSR